MDGLPRPLPLPPTGGRRSQLLQGLPQPEGVHGGRLVVLQELRPPCGVGWVSNGKRREDRNSDGIRDLIAFPEPTVVAADGKRYDGSDQAADQRAQHRENDSPLYWRGPGCARRRL